MLEPPADGADDRPSTPERADIPNETANAPDRTDHTKPGISFILRDDLIYYVNGEGIYRLCIPASIE